MIRLSPVAIDRFVGNLAGSKVKAVTVAIAATGLCGCALFLTDLRRQTALEQGNLDLHCPKEQLLLSEVTPSLFVVSGCGSRVVYRVGGECTVIVGSKGWCHATSDSVELRK